MLITSESLNSLSPAIFLLMEFSDIPTVFASLDCVNPFSAILPLNNRVFIILLYLLSVAYLGYFYNKLFVDVCQPIFATFSKNMLRI